MQIIIVGCGNVGSTIVEKLSKEGHNITVIDVKSDAVKNTTINYDVMGITGNGASYSTQRDAGIEDADLMIAVTGSDELNLLCCLIAKKRAAAIRLRGSAIRFTAGKLILLKRNWGFPW